jgi:hypothetical protein
MLLFYYGYLLVLFITVERLRITTHTAWTNTNAPRLILYLLIIHHVNATFQLISYREMTGG